MTPRSSPDAGDLFLQRGAVFSSCGKYRFRLTREWDASKPKATWIMLNPSIANDTRDDPTTTQCMNRVRRLGYGRYEAVNLFAIIGTDPGVLHEVEDPVGPGNGTKIMQAVSDADLIVVAWGVMGKLYDQDKVVLRLLDGLQMSCLGTNSDGSPRFPRAIRRDQPLVPFNDITGDRGAALNPPEGG